VLTYFTIKLCAKNREIKNCGKWPKIGIGMNRFPASEVSKYAEAKVL